MKTYFQLGQKPFNIVAYIMPRFKGGHVVFDIFFYPCVSLPEPLIPAAKWAVTPWAMCTWEAFFCFYSFCAMRNCKSVSDPPPQVYHKAIGFSSLIFPFCWTLLGNDGDCRGMSLIPSDLRVSRLFQGLSHLLPKA